jgi:hypothetical protein
MSENSTPPALEVFVRAERAEAAFIHRFFTNASPAVQEQSRLSATQVGDGTAVVLGSDPTGIFNRAVGFGSISPVTGETMQELATFFSPSGAFTMSFEPSPGGLAPNHGDLMEQYPLSANGSLARFICRPEDTQGQVDASFDIRTLTSIDAPRWAEIIKAASGSQADLTGFLTAAIADPTSRVSGIWIEDQLQGVGAVHLVDGVGVLAMGATSPTCAFDDRVEMQKNLFLHSAASASAAGADLLISDSPSPGPTGGNPTYRNLTAVGFHHSYDRQSWLWKL